MHYVNYTMKMQKQLKIENSLPQIPSGHILCLRVDSNFEPFLSYQINWQNIYDFQ